ncbi:hypothetical protein MRB53_035504 [Persea americana]|uniref:Uncharacterized protein n=1 Tax=Persea americana TaxID=3435 RepID=A0ACC2K552_PERAE|nr:hypothetical protein MRB53_035504 [Persea americana]
MKFCLKGVFSSIAVAKALMIPSMPEVEVDGELSTYSDWIDPTDASLPTPSSPLNPQQISQLFPGENSIPELSLDPTNQTFTPLSGAPSLPCTPPPSSLVNLPSTNATLPTVSSSQTTTHLDLDLLSSPQQSPDNMTCSQVVGGCEPLVHMPCNPASLPADNAQATNCTSVQAVDNDTMEAPNMLSLSNLGSNNPTAEHLLAPHDESSSNQHPISEISP